MKKLTKRSLAWVLTLCMVIAMLPAVPTQKAEAIIEDDGEIGFYFSTVTVPTNYVDGNDNKPGQAKNFAYIMKGNGSSITTLSDFANYLTYDNTLNKGKKRSSWKIKSAFASTMSDTGANASNPDKYRLSGTWARFYDIYGFMLHTYKSNTSTGRRASVTVQLLVSEGETGWYKVTPTYYIKTNEGNTAQLTLSLADSAGNPMVNDLVDTAVTTGWNSTTSMGVAYFTPGVYEFTMELKDVVAKAGKNHYALIKQVKLTPSEEPKDYSINLKDKTANIKAQKIEKGDTGTATLELKNGVKTVDGAVFEAVAKHEGIVALSVDGDKITVEGKKVGDTEITVSAKVGGNEVATHTEKISVVPVMYTYSFLGYNNTHEITQNITSYDMTAHLDSDPWRAGWQNNATITFRVQSPDGYGAVLGSYVGPAAGIKIKLPKTGFYTPETAYLTGGHEGIMRMYISPVDAENPIAPEYSVGHKDTYATSGVKTSAKFRTIYLEEGEYMVSWEIIGQNAGVSPYPRLFLSSANFIKQDEYPTVSVSCETPADIKMGNVGYAKVTASASDGSVEDLVGAEFRIENAENRVAKIEAIENEEFGTSLKITGMKVGQEDIPIDVYVRGVKRASFVLPVNIIEPAALQKVEVSLRENKHNTLQLRDLIEIKANLDVELTDADGQKISDFSAELQNAVYNFTSSNEAVAVIDSDGAITALSEGETTIRCDVTIGEVTLGDEIVLKITNGKARRSYYTDERVNAVQGNIKNYSWARKSAEATINEADRYLEKAEYLYDKIPTQQLPRSYYAGYYNDPSIAYCKHPLCAKNVISETGDRYFYQIDIINTPWKIQCPICRRKFPTNDFGSFYDLGIVEAHETELYPDVPAGQWSYEKSHFEHYKKFESEYAQAGVMSYEEHKAMREAGERLPAVGFLKNISDLSLDPTWGVDDGYGYKTGNTLVINGIEVPEIYSFIAYYNHWAIWNNDGEFCKIVDTLRDAYIYTGDAKYGRAGAILLDRVADIYPHLYVKPYIFLMGPNENWRHGKGVDRIWENATSRDWAKAYDAFFPVYDDTQVVSFLSKRAAKYNLDNPKTDGSLIREYIETNILRQMFEDAKAAHLNGNFGMTQSAVAAAAVVLDSVPETIEMLDWVFQNGETFREDSRWYDSDTQTGGDVMRRIIDQVSRDGTNDEIAPNYIKLWYAYINMMLDVLAGYDKYPTADLYNNPRYVKMLESLIPFTMSRSTTLSIADSGNLVKPSFYIDATTAAAAFNYTKKPVFAQIIYFLNGNKTEGLHYDMYTPNPERLANEVAAVIAEHGEYDFDKSRLLAGYGLAALRGGTKVDSAIGGVDTQRTFWMSFTRGYVGKSNPYSGHNHYDGLNLGIEAYGFNVAPDIGYPELTGTDKYRNWDKSTVAHNTVVVNAKHQTNTEASDPLHFDDSGKVKVMDVDASDRYSETEKYRRTVVTVDIDDEISYGVDFFRVKGGNEHVYSFHAMSSLMPETGKIVGEETQSIDYTRQEKGTYAGENVDYATANSPSGFAWLYDVDRAANVGKDFFVDFKIQDYENLLKKDRDLHLKLTMMNSFDLTELAFANGEPSDKNGVDYLKFMLAKRTGNNLDSMFTTVIEPYDGKSKIANIEKVSIKANGAEVVSEAVKALEVTLESGRVDYVIYAEDNSVEYLIDNRIAFQGAIGVYSEFNGNCVYAYINDGVKIGDYEGATTLTGTILSFTEDLTDENFMKVKINGEFDAEALVGEHIYVDQCARGNGVYEIRTVEVLDKENGIVMIDLGDISLIDTIATGEGGVYTYNHNIENGATFRIPRSATYSMAPAISGIEDVSATVGKRITKTVSAQYAGEGELSYEAVEMPRGAQFDAESRVFTWTPDANQVGTYAVGIRISDGALSDVVYFNVNVSKAVGSTAGNDSSDNSGSSGNAGAGGGGGGASGGASDDTTDTGNTDEGTTGDNTQTGADSSDIPSEKFTDLAGYDWAEEAINSLAESGVINGTSDSTYSPSKDITRADFTVLLVRAFGLETDSTDNFSDVSAGAYYAKELAAAKAHGIANGVGDNKYNPTATITRQDMMTIVSRTLKALGYEVEDAAAEELAAYADGANVSEYAAEHVASLIKNGIVMGSNGKINPQSNTTRAEVAVLIYRLINSFVKK